MQYPIAFFTSSLISVSYTSNIFKINLLYRKTNHQKIKSWIISVVVHFGDVYGGKEDRVSARALPWGPRGRPRARHPSPTLANPLSGGQHVQHTRQEDGGPTYCHRPGNIYFYFWALILSDCVFYVSECNIDNLEKIKSKVFLALGSDICLKNSGNLQNGI